MIIAEAGDFLQLGVPSENFAALATGVFTAVEQLSSSALHGYEQERSESAPVRERRRDELAELLLSDRWDPAVVRGAADRANWMIPAQVAVVMIDADRESRGRCGCGSAIPACDSNARMGGWRSCRTPAGPVVRRG